MVDPGFYRGLFGQPLKQSYRRVADFARVRDATTSKELRMLFRVKRKLLRQPGARLVDTRLTALADQGLAPPCVFVYPVS